MTGTHLEHNRPVHLARMLSNYERAMELVFQPTAGENPRVRTQQADSILRLLEKATKHAQFSILSGPALTEEKEFLHFLKLSRQSALAIRSMLQNEAELKAEEGFISEFLVLDGNEGAISAMHYERRSQDLIYGLSQLMRLAQQPYFQLKQKVLESLSKEDLIRYHRSMEENQQELAPSGEPKRTSGKVFKDAQLA